MITPRFRYNAGLGVMINIGPGQTVDVTPEEAAAYWASGTPPTGVTIAPEVPYGQAPIAPLPTGGPAPGGGAPGYSPFSPAPWPPQDTSQIAALGIPCLPPDWPGAGSGYYNSGSAPVPAPCTSLTADQLQRTTGEPLSAYGVTPCSPGSQQLCVVGSLPPVVQGGPGGGILFKPGGGIVGSVSAGGSGPGGIMTAADMTTTPPNVLAPPTQSRTVTPQSMVQGGTGVPNQGSALLGGGGGNGGGGGADISTWIQDNWPLLAAIAAGVVLLPTILSSMKR